MALGRASADDHLVRSHPPHRLDITARDLAFAAVELVRARDGERLASRVVQRWCPDGRGMACLSVRSAFHLLLTAVAFEPGDEVLVSAVTHPDMVRILVMHGLCPVPVDLDPNTSAVSEDALDEAVTDRTRAVVVAHLFGTRSSLDSVVELASRTGLLVIEDCAQSCLGPSDSGDPRADASLFSFGVTKTATALGGALVRVRDPDLLARMQEIQSSWPSQPQREYGCKLLKCLAVLVLSHPLPYGVLLAAGRRLGADIELLARRLVRGFPVGDLEKLRERLARRPSGPLLALLERRLCKFPAARLARRAEVGEELARLLPPSLPLAGAGTQGSHWVFPVFAADPRELVRQLRRRGFQAARATSEIAVVEPPPDRPEAEPHQARRMMAGIVFRPAYPEMPRSERHRLARALGGSYNR